MYSLLSRTFSHLSTHPYHRDCHHEHVSPFIVKQDRVRGQISINRAVLGTFSHEIAHFSQHESLRYLNSHNLGCLYNSKVTTTRLDITVCPFLFVC